MRICTITIRAGSKGVTGKNWRPLAGVPLFAHSVRHALSSELFDQVVVSSDSREVLATAVEFGATDTVLRPAALATDHAPKVPAIVHAVLEIERRNGVQFSTVVDLDATSPLREVEDIVGAVQLLETENLDSVITGSEARRSPYFNLVEADPLTGLISLSKPLGEAVLRRQDAPKSYDMNASIYVWNRDAVVATPKVFFEATKLYEMPPERSHDIDSELDFEIVSWLMERRRG